MKKRLAIILLSGVAATAILLRENIRHEMPAPDSPIALPDADPKTAQTQLASGVLLGPFKGLISTGLWWQMSSAESKGNDDEVQQLCTWLSRLQPHNGNIWSIQARNLAYNITFTYPDPETRWQWVRRGIGLLLDDGLRFAPRSEVVRAELATILLEKCCGTVIDFATPAYRSGFSTELCTFLHDGDVAELTAMHGVDLPAETFRNDPRVALVLGNVLTTTGLDLLDPDIYEDSATVAKLDSAGIFAQPVHLRQLGTVELFHRAKAFKNTWKVDFGRMRWIDSEYGPFDWRMPMAYIVYFRADKPFKDYLRDPPNVKPEIRLAMRHAFEGGRLMIPPGDYPFMQLADWRIIGKFHEYIDSLPDSGPAKEMTDRYRDEFLRHAAATLYVNDRIDDAKAIYNDLRAKGLRKDGTFDAFIVDAMALMLQSGAASNQRNLVVSSLFQAEVARATGHTSLAVGYERLAALVWERNRVANADDPQQLLPPLNLLRDAARHQIEHVKADHRGEALPCDDDHGVHP